MYVLHTYCRRKVTSNITVHSESIKESSKQPEYQGNQQSHENTFNGRQIQWPVVHGRVVVRNSILPFHQHIPIWSGAIHRIAKLRWEEYGDLIFSRFKTNLEDNVKKCHNPAARRSGDDLFSSYIRQWNKYFKAAGRFRCT